LELTLLIDVIIVVIYFFLSTLYTDRYNENAMHKILKSVVNNRNANGAYNFPYAYKNFSKTDQTCKFLS